MHKANRCLMLDGVVVDISKDWPERLKGVKANLGVGDCAILFLLVAG